MQMDVPRDGVIHLPGRFATLDTNDYNCLQKKYLDQDGTFAFPTLIFLNVKALAKTHFINIVSQNARKI